VLIGLRSLFDRLSGAGATAQAGQSAAAAGRLRYLAAGSGQQQSPNALGLADLRFVAAAATAQSRQAVVAVGRERFVASGAAVQQPDTSAGFSLERFVARR
jgi:hypothetical protein